jgi:TolB protein
MRGVVIIAIIMALAAPWRFSLANDVLPPGVSFVGLGDGEWRLFVVAPEGAPRVVRTMGEPRTPAYSTRLKRMAYISAAGELREIDLQTSIDSVLLTPSAKIAYTQPAYRPGTDDLYVVALRDGSSIETDIVRVDRATKQASVVLAQRSAQLEPAFSADGKQLLYSNVACASECPKVLQEIWTMDVVGGVAEQRTLLNSVSRQPVAAGNGVVLFVSNARGTHGLWRSSLTGQATPLAHTGAIADSPIVTGEGGILFIERTSQGSRIVRLLEDGTLRTLAVPRNIQDVRDLRWGGS